MPGLLRVLRGFTVPLSLSRYIALRRERSRSSRVVAQGWWWWVRLAAATGLNFNSNTHEGLFDRLPRIVQCDGRRNNQRKRDWAAGGGEPGSEEGISDIFWRR